METNFEHYSEEINNYIKKCEGGDEIYDWYDFLKQLGVPLNNHNSGFDLLVWGNSEYKESPKEALVDMFVRIRGKIDVKNLDLVEDKLENQKIYSCVINDFKSMLGYCFKDIDSNFTYDITFLDK